MASTISVCHLLILLIIATFLMGSTPTHAHTIEVGGSKGWTLHPQEDYKTWAARMRFSVNDTLHFKYNKGSDSVLVVSKDDYDKCNTKNPITKLDGGDSNFTFDRSGPFFFISGNKSNCEQGQKFHLVVLTPRNNQQASADESTATFDAASPFVILSVILVGFIGFA